MTRLTRFCAAGVVLSAALLALALGARAAEPTLASDGAVASRLAQILPALRSGACSSSGQLFAARRQSEIEGLAHAAMNSGPGWAQASSRWRHPRPSELLAELRSACRGSEGKLGL